MHIFSKLLISLVLLLFLGCKANVQPKDYAHNTLSGKILRGHLTIWQGKQLYGGSLLHSKLYNVFPDQHSFCAKAFKDADAGKASLENVGGHYVYTKTAVNKASLYFTLAYPKATQFQGQQVRVYLTFTHTAGGTFIAHYFDKNNKLEKTKQTGTFELYNKTKQQGCPLS